MRRYWNVSGRPTRWQTSLIEEIGTAVYLLIWPEDGIMKKEDIRGVYDGSIFYKKAEEHARKTGKAKNS